jgi:hypothetical protein
MNELTPFLPNATSTRMPELLKKLESLHVSSQALREAQLLILEASLEIILSGMNQILHSSRPQQKMLPL